MPKARSRRKGSRRGAHAVMATVVSAPTPIEQKPVRGVKLKTVSTWPLVFGLLCVAAFAAGRPPASAAGTAAVHGAKGGLHVSRTSNRRISGQRSRQGQGLVHQRAG